MCGRFALATTSEELAHHFNLKRKVSLETRYNIAPSQPVIIIRSGSTGNKLSAVRWGLIPHWAQEEKISYKLINARSETIQEKPSFRDAFKSRRCLIPTTGFYEWKQVGRMKQPYYIKMKNGSLFTMAGIWESWQSPQGKTIESCSIITTEPNNIIAEIHDRMPVIIPNQSYGLWLASWSSGKSFQEFLRPYSPYKMSAYPVSGMINNVKNEGQSCIRKIDY